VKKNSAVTFYIVTPSYNQAQFITQTIESVLVQPVTCVYWVMDAKSSDKTVTILKSFGRKIKWVSEKDKGQTDAINKGVKKFLQLKPKPTDIFAYINSDDYYLPGALKVVAQAFTTDSQRQWLVGDCQIINETNQEIQTPVRWYKQGWRRLLSRSLLLVLNPIPQPAVFIKWSAVKKVGLFNDTLRYVMDYEYWLRLFEVVGPPIVLNKPLAAFRIHGASKGGSQFAPQFEEELTTARHFTQNPAWLFFHTVHNEGIKLIYRLIK
jgi:glycosyltransferase involved in cell wall biosynthesis